jgi:hypothetical protein
MMTVNFGINSPFAFVTAILSALCDPGFSIIWGRSLYA